MNRDGFVSFAKRSPGSRILVSPLLSWYLHRVLSLQGTDARERHVLDELGRRGVAITATMRAQWGATHYTDALASLKRAELGLKTVWSVTPSDAQFAWVADVAIRLEAELVTKTSSVDGDDVIRAPFFMRDGLRGVRLDAADGARSLYLFWSQSADLDRLRAGLTPAIWQMMSREFTSADLVVSNLAVTVAGRDPIRFEADEGFGSFQPPRYPRDGDALIRFAVTRNDVSLAVDARAAGFAIGALPNPPDPSLIDYAPIAPEHRISAAVPLLYVLQDTATGAILLLGEND
jgi:hypothetical protein